MGYFGTVGLLSLFWRGRRQCSKDNYCFFENLERIVSVDGRSLPRHARQPSQEAGCGQGGSERSAAQRNKDPHPSGRQAIKKDGGGGMYGLPMVRNGRHGGGWKQISVGAVLSPPVSASLCFLSRGIAKPRCISTSGCIHGIHMDVTRAHTGPCAAKCGYRLEFVVLVVPRSLTGRVND
ncbi:hypothetical protein LX32DRAFT_193168 [Colletotrichum zoysiae]|uniref:Uncharacterized protein n=1 Tax=Colletotrichum zoysiae TaxID=1216348 RepID=A0AAD9H6F3_9PEZI|nr:hypothetical protein LX32DRAFT_193168 [Colletotrichum zoysiae]